MIRSVQKTVLSLILPLALCLSCLPAAAVSNEPATVERADKLVSLHVFRGTSVDGDGNPIYSLEDQPTRLQGLIMLIRLLGLEDAALSYDGPNPFSDMSGRFRRSPMTTASPTEQPKRRLPPARPSLPALTLPSFCGRWAIRKQRAISYGADRRRLRRLWV